MNIKLPGFLVHLTDDEDRDDDEDDDDDDDDDDDSDGDEAELVDEEEWGLTAHDVENA